MHQTKKMLAGAVPYVDFIDTNPPLINLLFTLPIFLAHVTDMELYVALNIFAVLMGCLSLFVSAKLLAGKPKRAAIISSLALALFSLSFLYQLFADREYLMVTLITPLLVLYSPLVTRNDIAPRWRTTAALMAGVGFCLKPYALPIYIAAMAYRLIISESPRAIWREAEHYLIIAIGVLYIAIVWIFFREYILSIVLLAGKTYDSLGWSWGFKQDVIIKQLIGGYGALPISLCALLAIIIPAFYKRTLSYLLFLMAGAIGSYALSAGWYYTQYPFIVVAFLLTITAGASLLEACQLIPNALRKILAISSVLIGITMVMWSVTIAPIKTQLEWDLALMRDTGRPMFATNMSPAALTKIEPHLNAHPRFLFLSFGVWSPNLLDAAGKRESVGRFDYLWPLPGITQRENTPSYEALVKWFTEGIADDIARKKPEIVICDISPEMYFLPPAYKILKLLRANDQFAKAWENYILTDTVNECSDTTRQNCAYQIYYRK